VRKFRWKGFWGTTGRFPHAFSREGRAKLEGGNGERESHAIVGMSRSDVVENPYERKEFGDWGKR